VDPTLGAILRSWNWRPEVILVIAALGSAYVTGWWRLRRRNRRGAEGWRLVLYLGGLAALGLALLSPIDRLGSLLFFVHMSQHELLTMVAPPLLLLGNALPVILWGLPEPWRRRAGAFLAPGARLRQGLWALTLMPLTWPLYVVTIWGWHWPVAYDASLKTGLLHDLQHVSFFITALLFWWPIVDPAPRLHGHIHHALRVVYAVPAAFQSQALGLILAFFPRVLYPHYTAVPRLWGYTPLQDQSAAGLLMMQFEGLIYLMVVLILIARMFHYDERMTRLREEYGLGP
jgi:putative membrane protein